MYHRLFRSLTTSSRRSAFAAAACVAACAAPDFARADFLRFTVFSSSAITSGQSLTRHELFAIFDGTSDNVLNVINFRAHGGWVGHEDAAQGFWHKDLSSTANPGVLSQTSGTWAPNLVGSVTANRPFDSFLMIGGRPNGQNSSLADPAWNSGANLSGWHAAQIPLRNDLGWFNLSLTNYQGRIGNSPNTPTSVKLGQFVLSADDRVARTYTLCIAVNNLSHLFPVFTTASFTLPTCRDWYRDLDNDGFGHSLDGVQHACTQPVGYAPLNDDNCPMLANPTQEDCNGNGIGDICELLAETADKNENLRLDSCEMDLGDLNLDEVVSATDLALLLSFWSAANPPMGDIDHDGTVTASDLAILLAHWGSTT